MKKFTFKKTIHEGRYRSFEKDHTTIKLDKKEVGFITEFESGEYKVYFAVKKEKTARNPAQFRWIKIQKVFNNENSARQFVKENNDKIQTVLDLNFFDD